MKLNLRIPGRTIVACIATAFGIATAFAQPSTWNGPATGGEWNTDASWNSLLTPGVGTNAFIGITTNVSYNVPMTAATILTLTNNGTLNINAAGFNAVGIVMTNIGSRLFVNNGGVLNVSGDFTVISNAQASMGPGSVVTINRLLLGADDAGASITNSANIHGFGGFTNAGGILNISQTLLNPDNQSLGTGTGIAPRLMILGGTNNLGTLTINRLQGGNSASPLYGIDGLTVSNGVVTTTKINLGNNNAGLILVVGGTFTNAGAFTVKNGTVTRPARFVQLGGFFSSASPATNVLLTSLAAVGTGDTVYAVLGGTNSVNGFQLGGFTNYLTFVTNLDLSITTNVNLVGNGGTEDFTNAATINIGSYGIAANGNSTVNAALNTGGRFFSSTDWTNSAPLTMAGGTFVAADIDGNPHNIYCSGALRGSGSMIKSGAGTMTMVASNIFTGTAFINAGSLVLVNDGVTTFGGLNSGTINVGQGATFDITPAPNFVLAGGKAMAGSGAVAGSFAASDNSILNPGGTGAQGTLTFSNGLFATNVSLTYELTDDTTGLIKTNDAIRVVGNLNVSGTNTFVVSPAGASLAIGTYKLIKYTGSLVGNLSNFAVSTNTGTLSNPPGEIDLIVSQVRPVGNLVWIGDGSANLWNVGISSNWLNGVPHDRFYSGDNVTFNDFSNNFTVNLSGLLLPAQSPTANGSNVVVNATNDFVIAGDGAIGGQTGLLKTNSGNLTILATNTYTGSTTIRGGTVSVPVLNNSGTASSLGIGNDSSSLVLDNGTLQYYGDTKSVNRGFTVGSNGGTLIVSNGATTLTLSGNLTGPGVLTKTGNGQLTLSVLSDYAGGTVIKNGTVRAAQGSLATISALGTGPVTLNGTNSANLATFWFGGDQEVLNNPLVIVGTLNQITNSGNDTVSGISGSGTVTLSGLSGNTLTIQAPDMTGFTGTLSVGTLGVLRMLPSSGSFMNLSNTTVDLGSLPSTLLNKNGNFTAQIGALIGSPSTKLEGASATSGGQSTYVIGAKNLDTTFSGAISEVSGTAKVNLVKTGTGTLTLNGGFTAVVGLDDQSDPVTNNLYTNLVQYTGSTTISNGVLAVAAPASISTSTNVTLASSTAVLDVSQVGTVDISGTNLIITGIFETGQAVGGLGTIRGGLTMDTGASLNVGLPGTTGVLTVTNGVILNGTTSMKLIKGNTPSSDRLVSSTAGSITYGGALVVTNGGGTLAVNDTFTLFSAPTLAGSFSSISLPVGYTWDTSQLGVNGTIKVTAVLIVTPPQFSSVNFTSIRNGTIAISATGSANGPLSILSSSNVTTPLINWTPVGSGTFDGSGNFTTNLPVNPTAPHVFYILSTP